MECCSLIKVDDSALPPTTKYKLVPGDAASLPCDDLKGEFRVLEDKTMVIKVVTPNEDLNGLIGDNWHINYSVLPFISFSFAKKLHGRQVIICVINNYYSLFVDGHPTNFCLISSFSNRLLESLCMYGSNGSALRHKFYYNDVELEMGYTLIGDVMHDVKFLHGDHVILRPFAPLVHNRPIDRDIVINSFTDIFGKYLNSDHLNNGNIIKSYSVTSHELMAIRKQIYELIMQRHEAMIKRASH